VEKAREKVNVYFNFIDFKAALDIGVKHCGKF